MKTPIHLNRNSLSWLFAMLLLYSGVLCVSGPMYADSTKSMLLAQSGKTQYVIALAKDAIPAEQTAALQLQRYVREISGTTLPIQKESEVSENQPQILVGAGERAKRLAAGVKWETLGTDGIVIQSIGKNLVLAGGRPRGTLYAVDTLLEEQFGVRWWALDSTTVPKRSTIRLKPQSMVYVPQIAMREVQYTGVESNAELATHLKLNGHFNKQGADWGGHNSILGFVHTFGRLLPVEKYFQSHPEWFSDVSNGHKPCTAASKMPTPGNWQLNLTSESARLELTKNALEWIRENPEAGMISISQNDGPPACNTPEENALSESEGSPSGPLLKFVNQVAADIEKQYPNFTVETLAYAYTRKPPRTIRPRHNVVIRLCSIEADFSKPLDSEANKAFRADVMEWKKLSPRLLIWDYVTNFANVILPYPNMNVLGANVKFFADNGAIGVFEQGNSFSGETGDFDAMRSWVLAKLLWNPRLDDKQLRAEFLKGYYGAAAPHLSRYIDSMQTAFLKSGGYLTFQPRDISFLTLDVMNQATKYFRSAEKAVAGNPILARRVRRERMALDHAWLLRYKTLFEEAEERTVAFEGPKDIVAFTDTFIRDACEFGVKKAAEAGTFDERATQLVAMAQDQIRPKAPLPDFLRGVAAKDIFDASPADMQLVGSKIVADVSSPTGTTVQVTSEPSSVGVMYYPPPDSKVMADKWRCYILVRVDAEAPTNAVDVTKYGIYDEKLATFLVNQAPEAGFVAGKYTLFDLGVHDWKPEMYAWVGKANLQGTQTINIARILFVRDKKSQ